MLASWPGRIAEALGAPSDSHVKCIAAAIGLLLAVSGGPVAQAEGPLERLKNRSAEKRWQELEEKWSKVKRPALPSPPSEPAVRAFKPAGEVPALQSSAVAPAASRQPEIIPEPKPEPELPSRMAALQPPPAPVQPQAQTAEAARLRKVTSIMPYFDYVPEGLEDDPCRYLCPRPDDLPCDMAAGEICPQEIWPEDVYNDRVFTPTVFQWQASNLYHYPLYFQDVALERYGHTHHPLIQPFVSVGRFGVQLLGLPYQTVIDPPREPMYTLGYYRPGEWAPQLYYQIPWNTNAAVFQAEVMTGLFFAIP